MERTAKAARAQNDTNDPSAFTTAGVPVGTAAVGVKTGAGAATVKGRLYSVSVLSKTATAYWLMVFDSQAAPIAAAVPAFRVPVPTSAQVSQKPDWSSDFGWAFANGCWFALSTTADTLTFAVANDAHIFAEFK